MRRKLAWHEWNPGLDNASSTLGQLLDTLPAALAQEIPWQVRLLENPASPLALPGAISLARHDALHVLLGRGLTNQDEAFVIGFTMGASKRVRPWQYRLFCFAVCRLYPKPYRFSQQDLLAFELGFAEGERLPVRDVHQMPFEYWSGETVGALRARLGLSVERLQAVYNTERALLPHSRSSRRLHLGWRRADPSSIWPRG